MLVVRGATPDDAIGVAREHVRAWQTGYRGLLPDEGLDGMRPADRATRYTFGLTGRDDPQTLVAADEVGMIHGHVTLGPARGVDSRAVGEIWSFYVDPDSWGLGVGRVLMSSARTRLTELGRTEAFLWVLAGNERAQRFYLRDGWTPDGSRRTDEIWGATVQELRLHTRL
ncbi:GNAT family N-acetyltransferase [Gordonia sp. CPCC 206044]|uniref:GNAT family N-acetyltransferase n=1 Tax=Gordonia sp. CPCC 206044 TaxID=3140793 RepID=UPI003AF3BE2B